MRILKVSQTFGLLDEEGGMSHVRPLARYLVRRGHSVTVLTSARVASLRARMRRVGEVEVVYLGRLLARGALTLNPGVVTFCSRRLRSYSVAHVYGLYDLLGPVAAWYCRRVRVPYVLEPMGMYDAIVSSVRKKRAYHQLVGRSLVRGAARLIAVSEQERMELVEAGVDPRRIVLRRNGVELDLATETASGGEFRLRHGLSEDEPVVLFLGRLSPVKGLELLLLAFSRLSDRSARLVLAGPEANRGYRRRLEQAIARLGLRDRVIFVGPLCGADKVAGLRAADVFVLPSVRESFGIAAAEAMACGTPVIVTDRCGLAPYVMDRGGVVVPYDEQALWHALELLLGGRELRERFRRLAPLVAEGFSWEQPAAETESLYEEILRSAARTN